MGRQIMRTYRIKPSATTRPTDEEAAEQAIDFIENLGYPLQPWQATTLRAMLTYPVGTRFVVNTPRQHPQRPGLRADVGGQDGQVADEFEDDPPQLGMVKVLRNGEWVWETLNLSCTCTKYSLGNGSGCLVHDGTV